MTDSELKSAFQQGDEDAFDEAYKRYSKDVHRVIRKYTPKALRSETQDVDQFFWTSIFQYAKNYDPKRPLRNYLLGAAVKASSMYYKAHHRRGSVDLRDVKLSCRWVSDWAGPSVRKSTPEEIVIIKEQTATVMEGLKRIPPKLATVIRAIYLHGEQQVDYARRVGISKGAVSKQVAKGLSHLRKVLNTTS